MIPEAEPAKAQPYVAGEHSRESLRYGTATHMQRAHIPFEGVGAALAIGLDSSGSPGALSVPRAHSSPPAALVGPRELAQLRSTKDPEPLAG